MLKNKSFHFMLIIWSILSILWFSVLIHHQFTKVQPFELPSIVWVNPEGSALERFRKFQTSIRKYRDVLWTYRKNKQHHDVIKDKVQILSPFYGNFLSGVSKLGNAHTIYLEWCNTEKATCKNLISQQYYGWAVDDEICPYIEDPNKSDRVWAYTVECNSNMTLALTLVHLDALSFYTNEMYFSAYHFNLTKSNIKEPSYSTYITIFEDVYVNANGAVYTNQWKIYPFSCSWQKIKFGPPLVDYRQANIYTEVFSIAQIYGVNVYHRNVEQLPRLSFYVEFLKAHPEIYIHVGNDLSENTLKLLAKFGLTNPVVSGAFHARVVYVPEGVPCGYINVPYTQSLSYRYRQLLKDRFNHTSRTSIVVIRRSPESRRYLLQQKEIENFLLHVGMKHGLKLEIFPDDPTPNLEETMKMFNRAVLVFGVHGAGLSNILYCQPQTVLIEVLSTTRIMMCFQKLAHLTGLRYYGISGKGWKKVHVNVTHVKFIVNNYMPSVVNIKEY